MKKATLVGLLLALPFTASALVFSTAAVAQEVDFDLETQSIPDEFEDEFFSHDETFFNNRSIARQAAWLLGIGFPDNEIWKDAEEVTELYQELLEQQVSTTPLIRTPDLPNPYQSSLLLTPDIAVEEEFPPTTLRQPIPAPAVQAAPAPVPPTPIPALW